MQFVHLELGIKNGGVQLVYEGTCCLAWVVIFDRRKNRGVVCVFFMFNAGGSVCGCMWVYVGVCGCIRAHTHIAQMGYSVVSPGFGMRHLEGPKNPDRLKRSIHIDCINVQSTFVCLYAGLRVSMIWANCLFFFYTSFLLRKVADVTTISKPQSLTSVRVKDCTLRVPNKTTRLFLYE